MKKTDLGRRAGTGPVPTRPCSATGCQALVNVPLLMCVTHWRLVPASLQRQVWASYRRVATEREGRATHLKAVQAAIDAVHSKQVMKKAKRDETTRDLF